MELTFRRPDDAAKLAEDDRARRVRENSDLCIIEEKRFFIRSVLPLPVASRELPYRIGLWVEVTEASFERICELWESEQQASEPAFSALIANDIPLAAGSLGLDAELHLTGPTTRPQVFLAPSDHRLYVEQVRGIDPHRAAEYTALLG